MVSQFCLDEAELSSVWLEISQFQLAKKRTVRRVT